jgi:hypothetical protein
MEWLRLDFSFILVAAIERFLLPARMTSNISSGLDT